MQNILHNGVSCYDYVVLIDHTHDKAFHLSSNEAMTNILHISYFFISLDRLLMINKEKTLSIEFKKSILIVNCSSLLFVRDMDNLRY